MNVRGESVFNFILNNNLRISNKDNTPTFENILRVEVIDITLPNMGNFGKCSLSDKNMIYGVVSDKDWDNFKSLTTGLKQDTRGLELTNDV